MRCMQREGGGAAGKKVPHECALPGRECHESAQLLVESPHAPPTKSVPPTARNQFPTPRVAPSSRLLAPSSAARATVSRGRADYRRQVRKGATPVRIPSRQLHRQARRRCQEEGATPVRIPSRQLHRLHNGLHSAPRLNATILQSPTALPPHSPCIAPSQRTQPWRGGVAVRSRGRESFPLCG
jgi:hypothetical protein